MRRPSPLLQLTLGLVVLTLSLLMLSDLLLGALPDRAQAARQERARVAQALGAQVAALMTAGDRDALEATLRNVASKVEGVASVGVRQLDDGTGSAGPGRLLAQAGGHAARWRPEGAPEQVSIALSAGGRSWGAVEVAFVPDTRSWLQRQWDEPIVRLTVFLGLAGGLAFMLYLRRALQHLDPASVIPGRVQHAFDAMVEGVVVLDLRGRVLLTNRGFGTLHPEAPGVRPGQTLSRLPWLAAALPADAAQHPWHVAMAQAGQRYGVALEVGHDVGQPRQLVVNCSAITDAGGASRGCLVTFDDLTELHHANAQLRLAMAEATAAKEEVQRKNAELERLATRDPLTGCLNRRALYQALEPMFAAASRDATPIGCLVLDIDFFKKINDTHGHGIGDRVIQEVARKLTDCARAGDLVCRYGGEEFVVVVPGLTLDQAAAFAERVRARIEAECGPAVREVPGLAVTVSIGCDPAGQGAGTAQAMIDRADHALYEAKRSGRNRTAMAAAAALTA